MMVLGIGRWQVIWNWSGWREGWITPTTGSYLGSDFTVWWFGPFELWRDDRE